MDERPEDVSFGLPWPEAYAALRPVIGEQWGVGDQIYLTRQLSGGSSGALVFVTDVTSRDFTGQAILKLDQVPDPAGQEKSEAERHLQAFEAAPDFATRHLPTVVRTAHQGEALAILSTVAGRGLEFAMPWFACDHDRQLSTARRLARALLDDWNRATELAPGLQSPQTLLRSWLGYRLDPEHGRLYAVLKEVCGLPPETPSFTCEGTWYPNPLTFAVSASEPTSSLRFRALTGHIHGDLHGFNVLVSKAGTELDEFYLLDLAFYEDRQFLFYDHAYFALAFLLDTRGQADASHWASILDVLCPFDRFQPNSGLRGDDIGLVQLLGSLRQEVFDWVDRNQTHRLSYMQSQFQLAQVAAGLNFANKQIDDDLRRRAILYAAAFLRNYLRLHNVDWPKHGPPLMLEGRARSTPVTDASVPSSALSDEAISEHPALPEKPAIAVLAFENQSGDPEQEYFADGVTDEIILALSRIDWLMVISRGSTFAYKAQRVDVRRVGKELGVHYVVEGAVRKSGDRVRVTAELVDAQAGEQLWADRFDRSLDDVIDLQEDVAGTIVARIDDRLKEAERDQATQKQGRMTTWDAFQRAMWHFYKFTEEDAEIAKAQLAELSGRVPGFAGVQATLALLQLRKLLFGDTEGLDDILQEAQRHASKAVESDEKSSIARIALSRVCMFQGKYDQAIDEAHMAVSLNPSSSAAYMNLAGTLLWGARAEEAMPAIDQSIRLSPKGPLLRLKLFVKGLLYYFLDDYSKSEPLVSQAATWPTLAPLTHLVLSAVFLRQERTDDSHRELAEARALRPQLAISRLKSAWRTMSPRYRDKLLGDLERAGLPN